MNKATVKYFTNFSDEDFVGVWDGKTYPVFEPGKTILLQGYLADHFAKHLIDRELNKLDIPTNNKVERDKMMAKCSSSEQGVADEEVAETMALNANDTNNGKEENDETGEEELETKAPVEVNVDMKRSELEEIAISEGIENAKDFNNKKELFDAILDNRGELNEDTPAEEKEIPADAKPVKTEDNEKDEEENPSDEDGFEGNEDKK